MVLSILAELRAARCQRGRQGRLECQGAQGAGGNREPKASPYQFHHGQHRLTAATPMSTPSSAELPIQEATLDLIRWFLPILHRLPRQHRHGLGERLITNLYELLEQLALARFQRDRLIILEPLRGRIQLIQLQTRLLHDFQLIDLRRYEHASRLITAVGRQHSAWLAQQRRPA